MGAAARLGGAPLTRRRRPGAPGRPVAAARRRLLSLFAVAGLAGAGAWTLAPVRPRPSAAALAADYVLLGEVHDNPEGHARRLAWLRALPPGESRALVFEQFDREHQAAIARWRAAHPEARGAGAARELARAGGFAFEAWDYDAYGPVIALALERGWDIRAGNLSRTDAMRIARDPALAAPPPTGWPAGADAALEAAVRAGHCGLVPESRIAAMALAQRSRDASMAQAMLAARAQGAGQVILLAGNGHVRRDHGVPAHLRGAQPDARIFTVGFIEAGTHAEGNAFDATRTVPPAERPDPCEQLRERFGRPRAAAGRHGAGG